MSKMTQVLKSMHEKTVVNHSVLCCFSNIKKTKEMIKICVLTFQCNIWLCFRDAYDYLNLLISILMKTILNRKASY